MILMDMRMPELDGHETTKRLKANPALKHIPVIAVTASSFREEEARARKICDGFIRKPFNRAELIAELKRFLKPAAVNRRDCQTRGEPRNVPARRLEGVQFPTAALAQASRIAGQAAAKKSNASGPALQDMAMDEIEAVRASGFRDWAEAGQWPALRAYAETPGTTSAGIRSGPAAQNLAELSRHLQFSDDAEDSS